MRFWKILTVVVLGAAIGLGVNLLLIRQGSVPKRKPRPQSVQGKGAGRALQALPRRPDPCFFLSLNTSKAKDSAAGEIADCLLLVPLRRELDAIEVDLKAGVLMLLQTDLFIPDTVPVSFTRAYRPWNTRVGMWETPTAQLYDIFPVGSVQPYTYMQLILPDGTRIHYGRISPGTGYAEAIYEHTGVPELFDKSRIEWNGNGWDLTLQDGTIYVFPEAYLARNPGQAALVEILDPQGKSLKVSRDPDGKLTKITSPSGHSVELTYASGHVTQARDSSGRIVRYGYNSAGWLERIQDSTGQVTEYLYDKYGALLTIESPHWKVLLKNRYDDNGRVVRQTLADGSVYRFLYTTDSYGNIIQVEVTGPKGFAKRVSLSSLGYTVTDLSLSEKRK